MNVVLPELDGRLLTRAISFKAEAPVDPRLEFASVRHEPDPDRIDYVARLAAAC
jgi:cobaltochelatase CobN